MTMLTPHRRRFLGGGGFQTRGFTTMQLSARSANMIYPSLSNHINYSCMCACQNIRRRTCRATCLASSCLSKKLGFAPCQHNCKMYTTCHCKRLYVVHWCSLLCLAAMGSQPGFQGVSSASASFRAGVYPCHVYSTNYLSDLSGKCLEADVFLFYVYKSNLILLWVWYREVVCMSLWPAMSVWVLPSLILAVHASCFMLLELTSHLSISSMLASCQAQKTTSESMKISHMAYVP